MSLNTALSHIPVKEAQCCLIQAQMGSRTERNWLERISPLFTYTHAVYNISKNSLRPTDSIASLKM